MPIAIMRRQTRRQGNDWMRQIIAMGGGGFSMEPENPALDLYVLAQTRKRNPSVCFLATATGDADGYIERFYDAFKAHRCRPTHVPLFRRTPDLKQALLTQDVIYVGGGNTKSMLAVWREWDVPRLLRRAWSTGTVLAGISAGAICWFKTGVTDSLGARLSPLPCLGLLPGACCPHFDGEAERCPAVHRLVASGAIRNALALDDGAAAHFVNRTLKRVVSSRSGASGYMVRRRGLQSVESALPVIRLTANGRARAR